MKPKFFLKSALAMYVIWAAFSGMILAWQLLIITMLMVVALIVKQRFSTVAIATKTERRLWRQSNKPSYAKHIPAPYTYRITSSRKPVEIKVVYPQGYWLRKLEALHNTL